MSGVHLASTLPPHHPARIGYLRTFDIPEVVTGSATDRKLGELLVKAWRQDGILQVSIPSTNPTLATAFEKSKAYFAQPHEQKAACVDDQSFAGYIASGEEITAGIADYSEIFTVTKDLPETDSRVQNRWPCHGPCPWPNTEYEIAMKNLMTQMETYGDRLLKLTAYGLGLEDENELNNLVEDGWHHMRNLRFPPVNNTNGKGVRGRGIGSHTDYGLLVIAAQDHVGGLFVRPPIEGEVYENWKTSAAGAHENDSQWVYVPPMPNVFTVFPGDMLQYLTSSHLPSTPHKVGLNTAERFAFAYFHEPNFNAVCKPLKEFSHAGGGGGEKSNEGIHYGTHFTNMFMRNYPERITAKSMREEGRMEVLEGLAR
ncbi:2-oxoglutarate-dependent ethylene/succinate-forming enzyme [Aulographum hederae CBS 113979]|uniref:2-oxoglutarate-dependent ethylene/succinate-forming enzyme n=1 Tax=Aulographum hederae CBS 113979 TaxID=1176131 RepID=A0A6G1GPS7_9PEZI|nr:2-oxoglutarate-dependent ethylene/succinate-forming enzyme [Aulographum hederae CBS 113979]